MIDHIPSYLKYSGTPLSLDSLSTSLCTPLVSKSLDIGLPHGPVIGCLLNHQEVSSSAMVLFVCVLYLVFILALIFPLTFCVRTSDGGLNFNQRKCLVSTLPTSYACRFFSPLSKSYSVSPVMEQNILESSLFPPFLYTSCFLCHKSY